MFAVAVAHTVADVVHLVPGDDDAIMVNISVDEARQSGLLLAMIVDCKLGGPRIIPLPRVDRATLLRVRL